MTIVIELVVKAYGEYILTETGFIHKGKINTFDFDKNLKDFIEFTKNYYKTDYVNLSQITIR